MSVTLEQVKLEQEENVQAVTPYLCVKGGERALDFYRRAFGAEEAARILDDKGRVSHSVFWIGDAAFYLADEHPEIDFLSPESLGGSPVTLYVRVPNVDEFVAHAAEQGAKITRAPADQEYGERNAGLKDPFGHSWFFATPL